MVHVPAASRTSDMPFGPVVWQVAPVSARELPVMIAVGMPRAHVDVTVNDCETWGAAMYSELPGWFAAIVQMPGTHSVTVEPVTVQIPEVSELNTTGSKELAAASTV